MPAVPSSAACLPTAYDIRRYDGQAYVFHKTVTTNSSSETGLAADTAYMYQVRARNGSGASLYSVPDVATTVPFTDDPVTAQLTTIKAEHFVPLRTAINAFRAAVGLPAYAFAPATLLGETIAVSHLNELRASLEAAQQAIGIPPAPYDQSPSQQQTLVRGIDLQEFRSRVK